MTPFPGYEITYELVRHRLTSLVAAREKSTRRDVLLSLPQAGEGTAQGQADLERALAAAHRLGSAPIVRPERLLRIGHRSALIYADVGARPVDPFAVATSNIERRLRLAAAMAASLEAVHAQGLVHRRLGPGAFLVKPKGQRVWLTHLGGCEASMGGPPSDFDALDPADLPWVSPELTGRAGQNIDERSDLYSLGALFFALFSGRLPLQARGPRGWVQQHLAVRPPSLASVAPGVPPTLGRIVDRLLAKDPEHRYQSAQGLRLELDRCAEEWARTGAVADFAIGTLDRSSRMQLSAKLHGREDECAVLRSAIERAAHGDTSMVMVTGPAGAGKTALVDAALHGLGEDDAFIIGGKAEQYRDDVPYGALVQALEALVIRLAALPDDEVADWRARLQQAVGGQGRVLVELQPDLALLLGETQDIPRLPTDLARNRIGFVFGQFMATCSRPGRPLVLVLDDLQWVDDATLRLVEDLLTASATSNLLVIGAMREGEDGKGDRARMWCSKIEAMGVGVDAIALASLTKAAVASFVAETLVLSTESVRALVDIIVDKTGGNPYFVREYLAVAHDARHIRLDRKAARWVWDLRSLAELPVSDSVLAMTVARLSSLPEQTRACLQVAAVIGTSFEHAVLARSLGWSDADLTTHLRPARSIGMVRVAPSGGTAHELESLSYRFGHDRIQEAAYSSIGEAELQRMHLRVGYTLLAIGRTSVRDERLFEVAAQLNLAVRIMDSAEERLDLAHIDLDAGRRALAAGAPGRAFDLARHGVNALPSGAWTTHYPLALDLHVLCAEAAYHSGEVETAAKFVEVVITEARSVLDTVLVYGVRINLHNNQLRFHDGLVEAVNLLVGLGLDLAVEPGPDDAAAAFGLMQAARGGRSVEALAALPRIDDPNVEAAHRVISEVIPAATMAWPLMAVVLTFVGAAQAFEHGYGAYTPPILGSLGLHLCGMGDVETGYEVGTLANAVAERFGDNAQSVVVAVQFPVFIQHRREPIGSTLPMLDEGMRRSLEVGNRVAHAYCANQHYSHMLFAGNSLADLEARIEPLSALLREHRQDLSAWTVAIYGQVVANLRGHSAEPWELAGSHFVLETHGALLEAAEHKMGLFFAQVSQLWLAVLHERWELALDAARAGLALAPAAPSMFCRSLLDFYGGLAVIAAIERSPEDQTLWRELAVYRENLDTWANDAPCNHAHRVATLNAEIARVQGRSDEALVLYDDASEQARAAGFVHDEALIAELAARLHASLDRRTHARALLWSARTAYQAWGAQGRVAHIDRMLAADGTVGPRPSEAPPAFDVQTLLGAAHAAAGEIRLDRLLGQIVRYVAEHTGSTSCHLLLTDDAGLRPVARLAAGGVVEVAIGASQLAVPQIPNRVLRYVQRTKRVVNLDDVFGSADFRHDPVLAQRVAPLSLLCLPLVHRGQVVGILYLENELVGGAFTRQREELLRVVCALAAASIDNARLYHRAKKATVELRASHAALEGHSQELERAVGLRTRELAEVQRDQELILESIFDGVCRIDAQGCIAYVNPAAERITGWSADELLGQGHHVIVLGTPSDQERCPICDWTSSELPPTEWSFRHHDGNVFPVEITGRAIAATGQEHQGAVITFRDISLRRDLEKQLHHAQRMEALGQFVGGLAHDFNNLLTPIIGGVACLRDRGTSEADKLRILNNIEQAADRAAALVGQFLAFGRRSEIFMCPTEVGAVVDSVVEFMEHTLNRSISLEMKRPPGPLMTTGDAGQLHQVLLNLCSNAQDALMEVEPPERGRRLRVELGQVELSASDIPSDVVSRPGHFIEVLVADNGCGMDHEQKARAFEPFFTTKDVGQGTGLGLAVVYGIVLGHAGWVSCESSVDVGTTVRVFLPLSTEIEVLAPPARVEVDTASLTGRVLIVDDERMVRELANTMLGTIGLTVIEAEGGAQALELYRAQGDDIGLVLLDLSMPGMPGRQALALLKECDPKVRVVLWSGFADGEAADSAVEMGALAFLPKPFTMKQLIDVVRTHLRPGGQ